SRDGDGLQIHKLMAEAGLNLIEMMKASTGGSHSNFEVMAHAGGGLSLGFPKQTSTSDKMVSFQVGLMPKYMITDHLTLQLDGVFVYDLFRDRAYNGGSIPSGNGSYFFANIGVAYRF